MGEIEEQVVVAFGSQNGLIGSFFFYCVWFIAERLSRWLIIVQHSQFTFVCMYVCIYVCISITLISMGSLVARMYRHDLHMVVLTLCTLCVSEP